MSKKKKPTMKEEDEKNGVKVYEADISDLVPDDHNFNKGTEYGSKLLEDSMRKFGAGRSVLIDKNNRLIGGNKATETAGAIDLNGVIIVETDGTKLVAVKRTDIDLDTKEGREMALADNAVGKANLEWDEDELRAMQDEFDFDSGDWGVDMSKELDEEKQKEAKEKYVDDWFINIECNSEQQCQELYDEFLKRGILCKIIH